MTEISINICQKEAYWDGIRKAAAILDAGGVVIFPTETVYGVGARVDRRDGLNRLRRIKDRSSGKPFTIHVAKRTHAKRFVSDLSSTARRLIRKGWPGPLTLLVQTQNPAMAPIVKELGTPLIDAIYQNNAVGLRCPDDHAAIDLLNATGGPVAAASANRAGGKPPNTAREAIDELLGQVDLVLDGGQVRYNRPSTIVRVHGEGFEIIREGVLDERMLRGLLHVNLLFVCTGNTCRSPMAEGLARTMIAERLGCSPDQLTDRGIRIESAGSFAGTGSPVSERAVDVLRSRGIDITHHESKPLSIELIHQADHIFTMSQSHRDAVVGMVPSADDKTQMLLARGDISDPIGSDMETYARCAHVIEQALEERLAEIPL